MPKTDDLETKRTRKLNIIAASRWEHAIQLSQAKQLSTITIGNQVKLQRIIFPALKTSSKMSMERKKSLI